MEQQVWPSTRRAIRRDFIAAATPSMRAELGREPSSTGACRAQKVQMLLEKLLHADRQLTTCVGALAQTYQASRAEGAVRTALEEGSAILDLLREIQLSLLRRDEFAAVLDSSRLGKHACDEQGWLLPCPDQVTKAASRPSTEGLTRKERDVMELLARGYSNDQIAKHLFISESTVRTHLRSINCKLSARSRTQAVAIARSLGLIS
jgi:LuxR family transcriptional regulator, maltose regulon positive regulatory protein